MGFFEVRVEGVAYAESTIGRIVAELPKLTVGMARDVSGDVMEYAVMPSVIAHTPVQTGALRDDTDWRITETEPELRIEVFSTAENVRSGYMYAKARAFGFNTVGSKSRFWVPPEDPTYPVAAIEDASSQLKASMYGAAYSRMATVIKG